MDSGRYKWIALSNTTLGVLLATLDASITLIAMPDIFRGIKLDPLVPANSFYLLWMILGYLVVSSVMIVSLGRLGDMYGRVRIYNLGFVIYTVASLLLTVDWMTGRSGATYLIVLRIVQGLGGACLLANAAAIITDAFPANQRGMALGINNIVGVSGMFVGLVLGGILAPINWRLVFLISVPVGLFGTVWAYLKLEERSTPRRARIDWWGNITFALGLVLHDGRGDLRDPARRRPADRAGRARACSSSSPAPRRQPDRLRESSSSASPSPMFRLPLFRIRAFTFGTLSTFLSAVARGGLMFMLIIWLQGIWLPEHGYSFERHAALGRDLHAAAHARHARRRPDVGVPLRPVRRAAVRDRRACSARPPASGSCCSCRPTSRYPDVRRRSSSLHGRLDGHVRLAEPRRRS